jgi:uncharacterized protein (DUF488 family)
MALNSAGGGRAPKLATIGYEGVSLPDFIATLKAARITQLIDIRELPVSRRKGFSKRPLSAALVAVGISYQHQRALGTPRPIRHRLRQDGNRARFFAAFRIYLASRGELLDQLARTLTGRVVLLCYERDPAECHRSVVAAGLAKRLHIEVSHLTVPIK